MKITKEQRKEAVKQHNKKRKQSKVYKVFPEKYRLFLGTEKITTYDESYSTVLLGLIDSNKPEEEMSDVELKGVDLMMDVAKLSLDNPDQEVSLYKGLHKCMTVKNGKMLFNVEGGAL